MSAGQVDAIVSVDPKLVSTVQANPTLRILQHDSGLWPSQFMEVDRAPFTDNRVRLAFKYMVDRKAIIDRVLLGYGLLGNDIPCPFDPDYAREIPQRPYDPEKATFLLKQAGRQGLTVTLYTSDVYAGILDSSVVMAEQAKKVGVTINLNKVPADQYWSSTYLKVPFEITYWGQKPLSSQFAQGFESTATFNEAHWNRSDFDKLVRQARRTLDPMKRHELWVEAQRLVWQDSGYIIWGFYPLIDGYAAKVHGLVPSSAQPGLVYLYGRLPRIAHAPAHSNAHRRRPADAVGRLADGLPGHAVVARRRGAGGAWPVGDAAVARADAPRLRPRPPGLGALRRVVGRGRVHHPRGRRRHRDAGVRRGRGGPRREPPIDPAPRHPAEHLDAGAG